MLATVTLWVRAEKGEKNPRPGYSYSYSFITVRLTASPMLNRVGAAQDQLKYIPYRPVLQNQYGTVRSWYCTELQTVEGIGYRYTGRVYLVLKHSLLLDFRPMMKFKIRAKHAYATSNPGNGCG